MSTNCAFPQLCRERTGRSPSTNDGSMVNEQYVLVPKASLVNKDVKGTEQKSSLSVESLDGKGDSLVSKANRSIPGNRQASLSLPPRLMVTLGSRKVLRFSAGASASITVGNVLGALGCIGTVANTTVVAVMSSMRINQISYWSGSNSSATSTLQLSWAAGESSQVPDEAVDTSIPQGITSTNCLRFRPPKGSLAAFWITSADAAAALFTITVPTGSTSGVLDLDVTYRQCDKLSPLAISVATAAVGHMYYLALDGPSGNTWIPTSLPTTH